MVSKLTSFFDVIHTLGNTSLFMHSQYLLGINIVTDPSKNLSDDQADHAVGQEPSNSPDDENFDANDVHISDNGKY